MNIEERIEKLKKLRLVISDNYDEIIEALKKDLGKSETESYMTEYLMVKEELKSTISQLKKWTRPKKFLMPIIYFFSRGHIIYRPFGKVGIASPWNYPFQLSMAPTIGALAAGNRVVLKTSIKTPNTSRIIKKILSEVYSEDEVLVYGELESDKDRFLKEDLDFIFFTGSTKVGRIMAEVASKKLIPCVLELGGKSPVIISDSANLEVSARRVLWGKSMNSGQTCVAPDYVLVDKKVSDEFIKELNKSLKSFYGENPLKSPDYSRIIDEKSMNRLINLSKEEGIYDEEKIDLENRKIIPQFFKTDLDSPFMREEIFGPYLPIIEYNSFEEVKNIIEKNRNPLALYLFTKNRNEEKYILDNVNFGGGCVNDTIIHLADGKLPFGGVGESGLGRYHGKHSIESFSQKTSLLRRSFKPDPSLRYPPYGKKDLKKFLGK